MTTCFMQDFLSQKGRRFIISHRLADDIRSGIRGSLVENSLNVPLLRNPTAHLTNFYILAAIEDKFPRLWILDNATTSLRQRLAEGSLMRETVKGAPMKNRLSRYKGTERNILVDGEHGVDAMLNVFISIANGKERQLLVS
ncbi:hypothetical protein DPMN_188857, partial [Dreissena polymorpha]